MRRSLLIPICLGLLLLAAGFVPSVRFTPQNVADAEVVYGQVPPPVTSQVVALGTLQPQGGLIEVGGTVGDRLDSYMVETGQAVKAGEPLARMESYGVREVQLQAAQLTLDEAQRRQTTEQAYGDNLVAEAQLGIDSLDLQNLDIKAQESKIKVLKANLAIAQRDTARMQKLDDSIVSPQERDHQKLLVQQAQAEVDSAQAMLAKSQAGHEFSIRQAQQKLASAKINRDRLLSAIDLRGLAKGVELAQAQLALSVIRSPAQGRILEIVTRPGENLGQQPLLRLGDTDHMYAVAEVYETQVFEIAIGQRATITSQALRQSLAGTVEQVGTMIAKNQAMSLDPGTTSDLRVVKARIRLDDSREAARMVNLQVTVTIDTSANSSPAPVGAGAPKR